MPLYPALPREIAEAVALVNASYRGEQAKQGWTHEADLLGGTRITEEVLMEDLAGKPGAALLLWRETKDGDLLGCVWVEPAGQETSYVGMLTVRPDLQGRRLGSRILAAAERFARIRGARCIRMTVIAIRDVLIAWYERRGYRRTGETRPFPTDPRFGDPLRDDLEFVVLEKALRGD